MQITVIFSSDEYYTCTICTLCFRAQISASLAKNSNLSMGLLAHATFGCLVLTLGLGEKIPIDILKNDDSILLSYNTV